MKHDGGEDVSEDSGEGGDDGGGGEGEGGYDDGGDESGGEDVDKVEWLILSCLRGLSDR